MTTTPEAPMGGEGTGGSAGPVAPPGARFDPVTGAELGTGGSERRGSFALQPGEPVMSFNMVTSLMPLASGTAPQTYRWALGLGVLIPVVAASLGFLAFAFVAAAVVVPAIYVVYMYDVNEWEDQPIAVVLGAIGAAAALGVGFTFLWHAGILGDETAPADFGEGFGASGIGVKWSVLLVSVLLVPVVSEILKQLGPLFLASRPKFDDMIDAMTFGVAAGATFAAAETIVVNRALFSSFGSIDSPDAGFWVSLILSAAVVKPIVYGAATGIALAAWSGLGEGFDGFKPAYLRGLGEALLANILFQAGLFLAARIEGTAGAVVGLVWGALIAAALVVRLRYLLHFAVLEAALENASQDHNLKDAAKGTAFCPSCEMPLIEGANFCVVCGTATRAGNKATRVRNRNDDAAEAPASVRSAPAGAVPQDNKKTAVVVGAVAAVILLAGAVGQGAAAAGSDDEVPTDSGVVVTPNVGAGPTTEEPPAPADPPGPDPDPVAKSSSTRGSAYISPALFHPRADDGDGLDDDGGLDEDNGSSDDGGLGDGDSTDGDGSGGIGGDSTGDPTIIDLGEGIGFRLPANWESGQSEPGFAQVFGPGGTFVAWLTAPPTDMETLITDHLSSLDANGFQEIQYSDPEPVSLPTSAVVEASTLNFIAVTASQQGGTAAVEGFAYYFVTQSGLGVTAFGIWDEGNLSDELIQGYNEVLNDIVATIQ